MAKCPEGWRSPARDFPLEWRTRPLPWCVVQARPLTGAKLVGGTAVYVRTMGVWVCLIWRITGSLKDWLFWADPCRRTRSGDERRAILFLASSQTPKLMVDVGWRAKHSLSANAVEPPSPSQVQWLFLVSKGAVSGSSSGPHFGSIRGSARLVNVGGSLALELGVRFGLLEQL